MRKILIVVDMQNDFIDGSLGSQEAQAIVERVQKKIAQSRAAGYEIIFTRDTHEENYLETQEGRHLPVRHCILHTPGWHISDQLPVEDAQVWDKMTFGSPEMAAFIKNEAGIGEIELVGLCTDICVISNALIIKAFAPEIPITVDAACCAGVTPESHKNALAAMKMCQIKVINE